MNARWTQALQLPKLVLQKLPLILQLPNQCNFHPEQSLIPLTNAFKTVQFPPPYIKTRLIVSSFATEDSLASSRRAFSQSLMAVNFPHLALAQRDFAERSPRRFSLPHLLRTRWDIGLVCS